MSVESILAAMADVAGRRAERRAAILGGTVEQVGQLPVQIAAQREHDRQVALQNSRIQEQMALERAREGREQQLVAHGVRQDQLAQETQAALSQAIGEGFKDDPKQFDQGAAIAHLQKIGRVDLAPTIAAVHEKFQPAKPVILKPGEAGFDEATRQPIPGMSVPEKPQAPSEAQLDMAAQQLIAKQKLGMTLSPEETANLAAYQERKRPVADPKALADAQRLADQQQAAIDRQSKTIQAQTDQQKRAQDFQQLQAARADIEKNVQTPYLTAKTSANTLRDVVAAAKSGNKTAAALQSLETTMAAIRAQGLNRINTAEIGVTANAGDIWDRISGAVGKFTKGEPVPANIQDDMLKFADILDKAARAKYDTGHKAATDLYGVTGKLQPLPEEVSSAKIIVTAPDGSKHPFDTQAQADAFKALAGIK